MWGIPYPILTPPPTHEGQPPPWILCSKFPCFHFLLCENKHSSFICSPGDWHSDFSRFVLFKQLILFTFLHISWGIHVPEVFCVCASIKSESARSERRWMLDITTLSKMIFWNDHANLHFYQQSTRDFVNPHLLCPLPIQCQQLGIIRLFNFC